MAENNVFNNEEVTAVPETPTPQTDTPLQTPEVDAPVENTAVDAPAVTEPAEEPVAEEAATEAPAEDAPTEEAPADTEPTEDATTDEAPAEEPAEETPVDEAPVEEPSAEEAPAAETPAEAPELTEEKILKAPSFEDGANSRAKKGKKYLDQPDRGGRAPGERKAPVFENSGRKGINSIPGADYVEELRKRGAPMFAANVKQHEDFADEEDDFTSDAVAMPIFSSDVSEFSLSKNATVERQKDFFEDEKAYKQAAVNEMLFKEQVKQDEFLHVQADNEYSLAYGNTYPDLMPTYNPAVPTYDEENAVMEKIARDNHTPGADVANPYDPFVQGTRTESTTQLESEKRVLASYEDYLDERTEKRARKSEGEDGSKKSSSKSAANDKIHEMRRLLANAAEEERVAAGPANDTDRTVVFKTEPVVEEIVENNEETPAYGREAANKRESGEARLVSNYERILSAKKDKSDKLETLKRYSKLGVDEAVDNTSYAIKEDSSAVEYDDISAADYSDAPVSLSDHIENNKKLDEARLVSDYENIISKKNHKSDKLAELHGYGKTADHESHAIRDEASATYGDVPAPEYSGNAFVDLGGSYELAKKQEFEREMYNDAKASREALELDALHGRKRKNAARNEMKRMLDDDNANAVALRENDMDKHAAVNEYVEDQYDYYQSSVQRVVDPEISDDISKKLEFERDLYNSAMEHREARDVNALTKKNRKNATRNEMKRMLDDDNANAVALRENDMDKHAAVNEYVEDQYDYYQSSVQRVVDPEISDDISKKLEFERDLYNSAMEHREARDANALTKKNRKNAARNDMKRMLDEHSEQAAALRENDIDKQIAYDKYSDRDSLEELAYVQYMSEKTKGSVTESVISDEPVVDGEDALRAFISALVSDDLRRREQLEVQAEEEQIEEDQADEDTVIAEVVDVKKLKAEKKAEKKANNAAKKFAAQNEKAAKAEARLEAKEAEKYVAALEKERADAEKSLDPRVLRYLDFVRAELDNEANSSNGIDKDNVIDSLVEKVRNDRSLAYSANENYSYSVKDLATKVYGDVHTEDSQDSDSVKDYTLIKDKIADILMWNEEQISYENKRFTLSELNEKLRPFVNATENADTSDSKNIDNIASKLARILDTNTDARIEQLIANAKENGAYDYQESPSTPIYELLSSDESANGKKTARQLKKEKENAEIAHYLAVYGAEENRKREQKAIDKAERLEEKEKKELERSIRRAQENEDPGIEEAEVFFAAYKAEKQRIKDQRQAEKRNKSAAEDATAMPGLDYEPSIFEEERKADAKRNKKDKSAVESKVVKPKKEKSEDPGVEEAAALLAIYNAYKHRNDPPKTVDYGDSKDAQRYNKADETARAVVYGGEYAPELDDESTLAMLKKTYDEKAEAEAKVEAKKAKKLAKDLASSKGQLRRKSELEALAVVYGPEYAKRMMEELDRVDEDVAEDPVKLYSDLNVEVKEEASDEKIKPKSKSKKELAAEKREKDAARHKRAEYQALALVYGEEYAKRVFAEREKLSEEELEALEITNDETNAIAQETVTVPADETASVKDNDEQETEAEELEATALKSDAGEVSIVELEEETVEAESSKSEDEEPEQVASVEEQKNVVYTAEAERAEAVDEKTDADAMPVVEEAVSVEKTEESTDSEDAAEDNSKNIVDEEQAAIDNIVALYEKIKDEELAEQENSEEILDAQESELAPVISEQADESENTEEETADTESNDEIVSDVAVISETDADEQNDTNDTAELESELREEEARNDLYIALYEAAKAEESEAEAIAEEAIAEETKVEEAKVEESQVEETEKSVYPDSEADGVADAVEFALTKTEKRKAKKAEKRENNAADIAEKEAEKLENAIEAYNAYLDEQAEKAEMDAEKAHIAMAAKALENEMPQAENADEADEHVEEKQPESEDASYNELYTPAPALTNEEPTEYSELRGQKAKRDAYKARLAELEAKRDEKKARDIAKAEDAAIAAYVESIEKDEANKTEDENVDATVESKGVELVDEQNSVENVREQTVEVVTEESVVEEVNEQSTVAKITEHTAVEKIAEHKAPEVADDYSAIEDVTEQVETESAVENTAASEEDVYESEIISAYTQFIDDGIKQDEETEAKAEYVASTAETENDQLAEEQNAAAGAEEQTAAKEDDSYENELISAYTQFIDDGIKEEEKTEAKAEYVASTTETDNDQLIKEQDAAAGAEEQTAAKEDDSYENEIISAYTQFIEDGIKQDEETEAKAEYVASTTETENDQLIKEQDAAAGAEEQTAAKEEDTYENELISAYNQLLEDGIEADKAGRAKYEHIVSNTEVEDIQLANEQKAASNANEQNNISEEAAREFKLISAYNNAIEDDAANVAKSEHSVENTKDENAKLADEKNAAAVTSEKNSINEEDAHASQMISAYNKAIEEDAANVAKSEHSIENTKDENAKLVDEKNAAAVTSEKNSINEENAHASQMISAYNKAIEEDAANIAKSEHSIENTKNESAKLVDEKNAAAVASEKNSINEEDAHASQMISAYNKAIEEDAANVAKSEHSVENTKDESAKLVDEKNAGATEVEKKDAATKAARTASEISALDKSIEDAAEADAKAQYAEDDKNATAAEAKAESEAREVAEENKLAAAKAARTASEISALDKSIEEAAEADAKAQYAEDDKVATAAEAKAESEAREISEEQKSIADKAARAESEISEYDKYVQKTIEEEDLLAAFIAARKEEKAIKAAQKKSENALPKTEEKFADSVYEEEYVPAPTKRELEEIAKEKAEAEKRDQEEALLSDHLKRREEMLLEAIKAHNDGIELEKDLFEAIKTAKSRVYSDYKPHNPQDDIDILDSLGYEDVDFNDDAPLVNSPDAVRAQIEKKQLEILISNDEKRVARLKREIEELQAANKLIDPETFTLADKEAVERNAAFYAKDQADLETVKTYEKEIDNDNLLIFKANYDAKQATAKRKLEKAKKAGKFTLMYGASYDPEYDGEFNNYGLPPVHPYTEGVKLANANGRRRIPRREKLGVFDDKGLSDLAKMQVKNDIVMIEARLRYQHTNLEFDVFRSECQFSHQYESKNEKQWRKNGKRKLAELKNHVSCAVAYEMMDNQRYYTVISTNFDNVELPLKADRDDLIAMREELMRLLDIRDEINSNLIELYTGSEAGMKLGTNIKGREYAQTKARKRAYRKYKSLYALLNRKRITRNEKRRIFDKMDLYLDTACELAKIKYILKNERPMGKTFVEYQKDKRHTQRELKILEAIIHNSSSRALKKADKRSVGNQAMFVSYAIIVLAVLAVCAITAFGPALIDIIKGYLPESVISFIKKLFESGIA